MQNIHELFGIVKGIDFDDVINSMEIDQLRTWVDRNRNLAILPDEKAMIKLIDSVIEDNIITDEEKETLNDFIDSYYSRNESKFIERKRVSEAKLFELDGVIQGILADGEVNEKEVLRLNEWIINNYSYLQNDSNFVKIFNEVQKILEDGVVTLEEQKELFEILSEQIEDKKILNKLHILSSRISEHKNIGIELIDILDNPKAIDRIHRLAEYNLMMSLVSASGRTYKSDIIFISLVLIAMLKYDGNFYDHVAETYKMAYNLKSKQVVDGIIRETIRKCHYYPEIKNKSRTINDVLCNSIVPNNFLPAFFDFIYDIYKVNFDFELPKPENIFDELQNVYIALANYVNEDDDNLAVTATRKTYKLINTTKQLIASQETMIPVIKLSIMVMTLIDKYVWDKPIKIVNPYIKNGFTKWIKPSRVNRTRIVGPRGSWIPYYSLKNNRVILCPPIHTLMNQKLPLGATYKDFYIAIFAKDQEVYRDSTPVVNEIIGGYKVRSRQTEIEIAYPLNCLSYRVMCGKTCVYDSCDKLYRSHIVFDENCQELKNHTDYEGVATFCISKENRELITFDKTSEYILASREVSYDSVIVLDEEVFGFSSLVKPGIFGEPYQNVSVYDECENTYLKVYKNVKYLVFECAPDIRTVLIKIGTKTYKEGDLLFKISELNSKRKYVVELPEMKNGIHYINVYESVDGNEYTKKPIHFSFAYDTSLEYKVNQLNKTEYAITLRSGILSNPVEVLVNCGSFPESGIEFSYKGKKYACIIPFDLDFYRISGKEWQSLDDYLWIEDIRSNSTLEVFGNSADYMKIYSQRGSILETIPVNQKRAFMEFPIGSFLNYKNGNEHIFIHLLKDGKIVKKLYCFNECVVDITKTRAYYYAAENVLQVHPYYYGKGNIKLVVESNDGNRIFDSLIDNSGEPVIIEGIKSLLKYSIKLLYKKKGLFSKEEVKWERKLKVFSIADLPGHTFRISKANFKMYKNNGWADTEAKLYETYLQISKDYDGSKYSGTLIIRDPKTNKIYYAGKLNSLKLNVLGVIEKNELKLEVKDKNNYCLHYDARKKKFPNVSEDSFPNSVNYIKITVI